MKTRRIGLFKTGDLYTLYIDQIHWEDFEPELTDEIDIKIKTITLQKGKAIAHFDAKNRKSLPLFKVFLKPITFESIQKKISCVHTQAIGYTIKLSNGIEICNQFWDDCTINIPKKLLASSLPKYLQLLDCNVTELAEALSGNLNNMFCLDLNGVICNEGFIENFEDYLFDIYFEKTDLMMTGNANQLALTLLAEISVVMKSPFKIIEISADNECQVILSGWKHEGFEFSMVIDCHLDYIIFTQKPCGQTWTTDSVAVSCLYDHGFRIMKTEVENYRIANPYIVKCLPDELAGSNPYILFNTFAMGDFDQAMVAIHRILDSLDMMDENSRLISFEGLGKNK